MSELPSVRLTGDSTERGRTHGEAFPEAIRQNVSTYMERFEHNGVPEAEVRDQAAEFLSRMENWNPAYAAELRGVAAGSRVDETDIAALNARYEVLYAAYSKQNAGTDGCTSFALLPETTADDHTYVGQNWDWIPAIADTLITTEVYPDNGPNHLGVTEARHRRREDGRQRTRGSGSPSTGSSRRTTGSPLPEALPRPVPGSTIRRAVRQSTEAARRNPSRLFSELRSRSRRR